MSRKYSFIFLYNIVKGGSYSSTEASIFFVFFSRFTQHPDLIGIAAGLRCGWKCLPTVYYSFTGQKEGQPVLAASDLLERRHTFHRNLVSIVKHHHKVSFIRLDLAANVRLW